MNSTGTSRERPQRGLLIALAGLALARLVAAADPGTWTWGFAPQSFLDPARGIVLSLLPLVLLVPPVGRAVLGPLERFGTLLEVPWRAMFFGAVVTSIAVALLPDQLFFIGDFIIRLGATEDVFLRKGSTFQSMPLDLLLHVRLPAWLAHGAPIHAIVLQRGIGVGEAAVFGALAGWAAIAVGLRGAALVAGFAVIVGTGALTTFTGLGKGASLLCMVGLVVAIASDRIARGRGGFAMLGLALFAGLFAHRASVVLLPLWLLSIWQFFRRRDEAGSRRAGEALLGIGLPVVALILLGRSILSLASSVDLVRHFGIGGGATPVSWLAYTFGDVRLVDMINALVAMAPIVLVAWCGGAFRRAAEPMNAPRRLLLLIALGDFFLLRPAQGIFRDWDVFALAGVLLSLEAVRAIGFATATHGARRALLPAIAALAIVPALQWMFLAHDHARGAARVRRFVEAAPFRPEPIRAATWDYLGAYYDLYSNYKASAEAGERLAELAPSPRFLLNWAISSARADDYPSALRAMRRLTERDPESPIGWMGLLGVAERVGAAEDAALARARLEAWSPDSPQRQQARAFARDLPELAPRE